MATLDLNKGKAMVTGASAGIGAIYADRLARRGYDLILVARDVSRLETLATQLAKETGRKMQVVGADLTKKEDLTKIENILKSDQNITLLLNNAGIAIENKFSDSTGDELQRLIDLNVTALTRLSNAVAPAFISRKSGTLINVGSVVAFMTGQFNAVYGASKSYVLFLTQGLHAELAPHGIQVQAVLPGATRTEIWERSGMDLNQMPSEMIMSADDLVDASLAGLDQKELVTIPSLSDTGDWDNFEKARIALLPNLSHKESAARYR